MADIADITESRAELMLNVALDNSRRDEPNVQATGECLYCGKLVPTGFVMPRRWCDAECRDAWEVENN